MTPVLMQFLTSTGEPLAFANVDIQLSRSNFDPEVEGVIMPRLVQVKTGMDGKALVHLMPSNEHYHVTAYDTLSDVGLHYHFYVPFLNNPEAVVRLQDVIVKDDATLSDMAYDEAALLQILDAKANTLASRDEAVAAAAAAQVTADFVDDVIDLTLSARDSAQSASTAALNARDVVLSKIDGAHDSALLAEDRAAAALQAKTDAVIAANAAMASAIESLTQAQAAELAANNAQSSEDTVIAARDAATIAAGLAVSSHEAADTARDAAITARDVTLDARDTAVQKAAQLASQLHSFNEIYIGKFAEAPTVDGNGNALKVGAIYENTVEGKIYQWESDLAWHPYDEESQAQLNSAILSATNAASSAGSALAAQIAADAAAADALTYRNAASSHAQSTALDAAAAVAAKDLAVNSANLADSAADTATVKAAEAAQSAADAQLAASQAIAGQLQADWLQADPAAQDYIKNKPAVPTKADMGLDQVDNTRDVDKPVSTAMQTALNAKQSISQRNSAGGYVGVDTTNRRIMFGTAAAGITSYLSNSNTASRIYTFPNKAGTVAMLDDITGTNSGTNTGDESADSIKTKLGAASTTADGYLTATDHAKFTAKQDALGFTPVNANTVGAANGLATLGADGKVPAGQLPAFVDDVLEYAGVAAFPVTGESGKIYVDTTVNTNNTYRWSGSAYILISSSPGSTDAVPEGVTNKYFTDARALAAAQSALNAKAAKGANSDITSLSGLTTALSVAQGGTGATTAAAALTALGATPLTGTGTSGTWPIGISGLAAKASTLAQSGGTGIAMTFNWLSGPGAGLPAQPNWLWGGNDGVNMYVFNPSAFSVDNAGKLGSISAGRTMQRRQDYLGNGAATLDSLLNTPATYGFAYATSGSYNGPFMHFGGLGGTEGNYAAQFSLPYGNGKGFRFRVNNGDTGVWNPWYELWHNGNMPAPSVAMAGDTLVQRDANGYVYGNYINMTDEAGANGSGAGGTVTAIITKKGDSYYRSANAVSVKAYLAIRGYDVGTDRADKTTFVGHAWELSWKNYGNGHTIFDASASTSPIGTTVNNRDAQIAWSNTYPTLMGWNGANTYGVRVDSARIADCIGGGVARGSYGSASVRGTTNSYAGIDLTDVNGTFMSNGSTTGYYINNNQWIWTCTHSGDFWALGNVTAYSDERVKTNWRPVAKSAKAFVRSWAKTLHGVYDRTDIEATHLGLGAQSVRKTLPRAVIKQENGQLSLNYGAAAGVASVQEAIVLVEHDDELIALRKEVKRQAKQLKELTKMVKTLMEAK